MMFACNACMYMLRLQLPFLRNDSDFNNEVSGSIWLECKHICMHACLPLACGLPKTKLNLLVLESGIALHCKCLRQFHSPIPIMTFAPVAIMCAVHSTRHMVHRRVTAS